jgi:hypothetical protein
MSAKTTSSVKWVVPGRRPAPARPPARSSSTSPRRRRLQIAALLVSIACALAAFALRLARPEVPAPAAPTPLKVVRQEDDANVYETENIRVVFRKDAIEEEGVVAEPAPAETETP